MFVMAREKVFSFFAFQSPNPWDHIHPSEIFSLKCNIQLCPLTLLGSKNELGPCLSSRNHSLIHYPRAMWVSSSEHLSISRRLIGGGRDRVSKQKRERAQVTTGMSLFKQLYKPHQLAYEETQQGCFALSSSMPLGHSIPSQCLSLPSSNPHIRSDAIWRQGSHG